MKKDLKPFSRFLAYVLRHNPVPYDIILDENGYADIRRVLQVLTLRFHSFLPDDLFRIVENDPKGRFEIVGERIRARYGHSLEVSVPGDSVVPPHELYHGTSLARAQIISREGLKPLQRRWVHLSVNAGDAYMVGLRRSRKPVILSIEARRAQSAGVEFFRQGYVFLTDYVGPGYIHVKK